MLNVLMACQNAQVEIPVVNCRLVNGDVVLYQKPHVVQMEFIVAQMDIAVTLVGYIFSLFVHSIGSHKGDF